MASSSVRRAVYVAAALAALLLVTVAVVPFLVSKHTLRSIALRALDRGCGCTVVARGRFDLTLWPEPGLVVTRLRVEDPPGFARRPLLRVRRVTLRASWGKLLAGRWVLSSARFRKVRLVLRRNARGQTNLSAFFHARGPASRSPPGVPAPSVSSADPLAVFGRLVLDDFEIVEAPGTRLLAEVRSLELGPRNRHGLPIVLSAGIPTGKGATAWVGLRGNVAAQGDNAALDLTSLRLRDPSLFPGRLATGAARIEYVKTARAARLRVSPVTLSDPRLGRAVVEGEVVLVGSRPTRETGELRMRLLPSFVLRMAPWLRPRPVRTGLRFTARFVGGENALGPAPFALAWQDRRGRAARLQGTLVGKRQSGRWDWSLQAEGSGLGVCFAKTSRATKPASAPAEARTTSAPTTGPRRASAVAVTPSGPGVRLYAKFVDSRVEGVPVPRMSFEGSFANSRARVSHLKAALLGGILRAAAQARLVGAHPSDLTTHLSFQGIELAPLLRLLDPKGGANLSGRIAGDAFLASRGGVDLAAWHGSGEVRGSNLVWRGVDLAAIVQTLGRVIHGRIPQRWPSGGATPFGHFHSNWTLAGGRVTLQKLALQSSLLDVTGGGNLDLVGQGRLDLSLELAPGAGAARRGWPQALRGIDVPLHVGGTLARPLPIPDASAVLHRLLRRRLGGILGRFLGGG
jgi:hypothetical protein